MQPGTEHGWLAGLGFAPKRQSPDSGSFMQGFQSITRWPPADNEQLLLQSILQRFVYSEHATLQLLHRLGVNVPMSACLRESDLKFYSQLLHIRLSC